MVIAKVPTSESVACPLRELPHLHLHLHLHLQLDLDPFRTSALPTASSLAHSALAYWLPANWSAVFIELYVERGVQGGGGRKGEEGKIGMSGGGGDCSEDYEDDIVVD